MHPRISVAMATYNGERYVGQQLASFAAQSQLPFELVVTDDGSTDGTLEILERFALSAPFEVRIHRNERNLGFADNFLHAATLCKGDWIAFSDQDDVWLPQKMERLSHKIIEHSRDDVVLVGHTSLITDANLTPTGQRLPDYPRDELIKYQSNFGFFCIVGFSMCCDARLVREFDHHRRPTHHREAAWTPPGHDQWLSMLANIVGNIALISEPLAFWRRHDLSLTRPPRPQTIWSETAAAATAFSPDAYFLRSRMAEEAAESFRSLATFAVSPDTKGRLAKGDSEFKRLSEGLRLRGELYSAKRVSARWRIFSKMLLSRCYFGSPVGSLGLRPFLKDILYSAGALSLVQTVLT